MRTFAFIACCIFFTVLLTPITGPVGPLAAIWIAGKILGASTPKGTSAGEEWLRIFGKRISAIRSD